MDQSNESDSHRQYDLTETLDPQGPSFKLIAKPTPVLFRFQSQWIYLNGEWRWLVVLLWGLGAYLDGEWLVVLVGGQAELRLQRVLVLVLRRVHVADKDIDYWLILALIDWFSRTHRLVLLKKMLVLLAHLSYCPTELLIQYVRLTIPAELRFGVNTSARRQHKQWLYYDNKNR